MPDVPTPPDDRHHLSLYRGGGSAWGHCSCGWSTPEKTHANLTWAQLQFGRHLLESKLGRSDA